MNYTEKIEERLTGAHLSLGKIEHKPFKRIGFCFFIVEHTEDKEFLSKQIRQLAVAGCRNYVFYGNYSRLWKKEADSEIVMIDPDGNSKNDYMTVACNKLEGFVEDILREIDISERIFVPCENYLLYDDWDIYEIVRGKLKNCCRMR